MAFKITSPLPIIEGGTEAIALTDHGVLVGSGTGAITPLAVGATGTLLVGAAGADPAFATSAAGSFSFTNATAATTLVLGVENNDTDPGSYACLSVSTEPAGGDAFVFFEIDSATQYYAAGIDNSDSDKWKLTNNVDPSTGDALMSFTSAGVLTLFNDLDVSEGGTGVSTLTSHGILMGNGAGDINATAEPSNGQILIGSTGNFPALGTITAGTNITVTNAAGSITIDTNGFASFGWRAATADTNMTVNTGYLTKHATPANLLTYTLPASAVIGDVLRIGGYTAGMWLLAQNANQQIFFDGAATTIGVGGSLAATGAKDCIELVCVTADLEWLVVSSIGNITIV